MHSTLVEKAGGGGGLACHCHGRKMGGRDNNWSTELDMRATSIGWLLKLNNNHHERNISERSKIVCAGCGERKSRRERLRLNALIRMEQNFVTCCHVRCRFFPVHIVRQSFSIFVRTRALPSWHKCAMHFCRSHAITVYRLIIICVVRFARVKLESV